MLLFLLFCEVKTRFSLNWSAGEIFCLLNLWPERQNNISRTKTALLKCQTHDKSYLNSNWIRQLALIFGIRIFRFLILINPHALYKRVNYFSIVETFNKSA